MQSDSEPDSCYFVSLFIPPRHLLLWCFISKINSYMYTPSQADVNIHQVYKLLKKIILKLQCNQSSIAA